MNNKDDYKEEIAIVYINNEENLKIFIEIFINNNKDKYEIIYEGNGYNLTEYFNAKIYTNYKLNYQLLII